jgi:hypothetical protein
MDTMVRWKFGGFGWKKVAVPTSPPAASQNHDGLSENLAHINLTFCRFICHHQIHRALLQPALLEFITYIHGRLRLQLTDPDFFSRIINSRFSLNLKQVDPVRSVLAQLHERTNWLIGVRVVVYPR